MKHFNLLDEVTYNFLVNLKSHNEFWFMSLISCAKINPKLVQVFFKDLKKHLPLFKFEQTQINIFQICKATNSGLLTDPEFLNHIDNFCWYHQRHLIVQKFKSKFKSNT